MSNICLSNGSNKYSHFNAQFPVYNWIYPIKLGRDNPVSSHDFSKYAGSTSRNTRALYFHIPFCETICNFCTLNKSKGSEGSEIIEEYISCLIREVECKSRYEEVVAKKIDAIFFGGGSPSILNEKQIARVMESIHKHFTLEEGCEITFETEVKSITENKIKTLHSYGVNKIRFGVQALTPNYREYFNLTSTLYQVEHSANVVKKHIDNLTIDMIYGMDGQSIDNLVENFELAAELGAKAIDPYPISYPATLPKLESINRKMSYTKLTMHEKMAYSTIVKEILNSYGHINCNGNGFVKSSKKGKGFLCDEYFNRYNSYIFGKYDMEIIGFGSSSISNFENGILFNESKHLNYIKKINDNVSYMYGYSHGPLYEKNLSLSLPYHGYLNKDSLDISKVPEDTISMLNSLIDVGLIIERENYWELPDTSWKWYVNMMYSMTPALHRDELDKSLNTHNKVLEKSSI